jgi:hypothetical protein
LEWMIVILITIEVMFELGRVFFWPCDHESTTLAREKSSSEPAKPAFTTGDSYSTL